MLPEQPSEILSILELIRRGRFSAAVPVLERRAASVARLAKGEIPTLALLADVLQRVGDNDRAEDIALRILRIDGCAPEALARCRFALGNVHRDRGKTAQAIEHLQIAATLSSADVELSSWAQLRLMVVVAELSGAATALARINEVKRALIKCGDARPFAALHLWFVEVESVRGNLERARQHLKAADSLLSSVDDVWLRGYLAINSSAVHYYSAEMPEARRCAEIATEYARASGHRATLRAANANLGNIEFSLGNDSRAEECFEVALACCETGSVHQIAILDNLAQIRLHRGDLDGCRLLVAKLEHLIEHNQYDKRRHYTACALQTKIRLLLKEGRSAEALRISQQIVQTADSQPQARVSTETHLLNVEALLANQQAAAAADALSYVLLPQGALSADLFAKLESVSAQALASSNNFELAEIRFERAVNAFSVIGHSLSKEHSRREFQSLAAWKLSRGKPASSDHGAQTAIDRIRALMDLRTRPELFGHEAAALLKELACTARIDLVVDDGIHKRLIKQYEAEEASGTTLGQIALTFDAGSQRTVTLSFVPLDSASAKLTAMSFYRVVKQIVSIGVHKPTVHDEEIVWATGEGNAASGVIFRSDSMLAVLRTVKQIAPTDVSVLVTGETGTGKEVIARTIHEYSRRAAMPFLALNCAAVPKDLLESQLFGHRKGAFSGATDNHLGIVRAANGGTLFLDEIGELPLDMQAKLLRFLEMSEVHPVGESHPVKVNVRLIFATNGDLEEAVSQHRFRQDLFYRLNVIPIKVPPLRERREEIPVLVNLFAQRFAPEFAKEPVTFSASAMELLILYAWPGNIRQLANEVRRLTALSDSGACVAPEHLSPQLQAQLLRSASETAEAAPSLHVKLDQPLDKATAHLESEMIKRALRQSGGRMSAAASTLGISRKGLYLKRMRLGLADANNSGTNAP